MPVALQYKLFFESALIFVVTQKHGERENHTFIDVPPRPYSDPIPTKQMFTTPTPV